MKISYHLPTRVCHNTDTHFLKLIAIVLMACDHAGMAFFPQFRVLRIIGRPAFPLFAYCLAAGAVYTRDPHRYAGRLAAATLVSQPFYVLAFGRINLSRYSFSNGFISTCVDFYIDCWKDPSIMFTLILAFLIICTLRGRQFMLAFLACVLCIVYTKEIDYGYKGVLLCVLFYVTIEMRVAGPAVMTLYMLWWAMAGSEYSVFGVSFSIQLFAMAALPLIYIPMRTHIRLPRLFSYAFYPAHLFGIYIARMLIGR